MMYYPSTTDIALGGILVNPHDLSAGYEPPTSTRIPSRMTNADMVVMVRRTYRNTLGFWWERARAAVIAKQVREHELIENAQRYAERIAGSGSKLIRAHWRLGKPLYIVTRVCEAHTIETVDLRRRTGCVKLEQQIGLLRSTLEEDAPQEGAQRKSHDSTIVYAFSVAEVLSERPSRMRAVTGIRLWGKKIELTPV